MKKIASFTVDHNRLERGLYISRRDNGIDTWDLRTVKPNTPPYMEQAAMHTVEHLGATLFRNSEFADSIVYFGPMGCRTGFYLLTREMADSQVVSLVKSVFEQIALWDEPIPGASLPEECGNYLEHDLDGARKIAVGYNDVIRKWTAEDIYYC